MRWRRCGCGAEAVGRRAAGEGRALIMRLVRCVRGVRLVPGRRPPPLRPPPWPPHQLLIQRPHRRAREPPPPQLEASDVDGAKQMLASSLSLAKGVGDLNSMVAALGMLQQVGQRVEGEMRVGWISV